MSEAFPGDSLQMDLLTVVTRLEQIESEPHTREWMVDRILNSDLPRLRGYLTDEVRSWAARALAANRR